LSFNILRLFVIRMRLLFGRKRHGSLKREHFTHVRDLSSSQGQIECTQLRYHLPD